MIEGRDLIVKTDHKPLTFAFLQRSDKASPRQLRQLDFISQFTTSIVLTSGSDNRVAHALSRIEQIDLPLQFHTSDLAQAQKDDQELQNLLKSESSLQLRRLRIDDSENIYCDISIQEIRPYIPLQLRRRIFDVTHGLAHPSSRTAIKLIQKRFV